MQVHNLLDVFVCIDELHDYLESKGVIFNQDGFPILFKEMFLEEWPDLVVPFAQRNNKIVTNRKRTLLCHFDKDEHLYPRISKVLSEIDEYASFMGVVGLDITITDDMDEEWQTAIALLNQLFLAVLAINGIKIVMNSRSASMNYRRLFENVPQDVMIASGFLGCAKTKEERDFSYLEKILAFLPNKLILYGKHDKIIERQLEAVGIDYRVYTDFHRLCQEVRNGRQ